MQPPPDNESILSFARAAAAALDGKVVRTPVVAWPNALVRDRSRATAVVCKLENLQVSGSFKARGALYTALRRPDSRSAGFTAFSAGNHAVAVAFAAREVGATAKVVMPKTADPFRVARVRRFGGEPVFADSGREALAIAEGLVETEGRLFIHPFEGPDTVAGTGAVGLELVDQADDLDAVIVAVGGGGLAAGVASVVKALRPGCKIYGVEPETADNLARSLAAGAAIEAPPGATIADSLAPPMCMPFSFELCRRNLDRVVTVSDAAMLDAMRLWSDAFNLPLEPAGAAATAALLGPLSDETEGLRVGLIVCGANIAPARFAEMTRSAADDA